MVASDRYPEKDRFVVACEQYPDDDSFVVAAERSPEKDIFLYIAGKDGWSGKPVYASWKGRSWMPATDDWSGRK